MDEIYDKDAYGEMDNDLDMSIYAYNSNQA